MYLIRALHRVSQQDGTPETMAVGTLFFTGKLGTQFINIYAKPAGVGHLGHHDWQGRRLTG
jgi:hypothetical protein